MFSIPSYLDGIMQNSHKGLYVENVQILFDCVSRCGKRWNSENLTAVLHLQMKESREVKDC